MQNVVAKLESWLDRIDTSLGRSVKWPYLLFALAFLLKLAYILQSADALFLEVPIMDSKYYDDMAVDIAAGNFVRQDAFFMGPLYPYLLSIVYSIFGRDVMIVRILQIASGSLVVVMTYLLGCRLFRPSIAMLAALLLTFYGTITFYEGQILMSSLGTVLNIAALLVLAGAVVPGLVRLGISGGLLGLSALARANILVFAVVVIVWIVVVLRHRRPLASAGVFVAGILIALLPATVHNFAVSKDFVLITSNAGVNFFIGNNEFANGIFYPLPELDFVMDATTRSYVERRLGKDLTPSQVSAYWFDLAWKDIGADPGRSLELLGRKFVMFFNGYEVPQIESYKLQRREYGALRMMFVNFQVLAVLGILGMIFIGKRWRSGFLPLGFVISYAASISLFFVTARYRVQIAPVMCLFAAYALLAVIPHMFSTGRRATAVVLTVAVLALTTSPRIFAADENEILFREHVHKARRMGDLGRHDEALEEIGMAIGLFPDNPEGYIHRAIIHNQENDQFRAIEDYNRTLRLDPNLPSVRYDLAQSLRRLKMTAQAIDEYHRAIELDPYMIQAYNNLGIAYRDAKDLSNAIITFRKVIEMDPSYIKAYNNLGGCMAENGSVDEAIYTFRQAIEIDPRYALSYKNLAMAHVSKREVTPALVAMERYVELEPEDAAGIEIRDKLRVAAGVAGSGKDGN